MKKETLQRLQDLLHDARAKAKQSDRLEDWKRVSYLRKAV